MSDVRPTKCPYCSEPAIFDERKNIIICEHCDAEYKVTKQGGAKVKKTGIFDDHENRLQALEKKNNPPGPGRGLAEQFESGIPGPGGDQTVGEPGEDPEDPSGPEETETDDDEIFPE